MNAEDMQRANEIDKTIEKLGLKKYAFVDLETGFSAISGNYVDIITILTGISIAVWKDKHGGEKSDSHTPYEALRDALEVLQEACLKPGFYKSVREDTRTRDEYEKNYGK